MRPADLQLEQVNFVKKGFGLIGKFNRWPSKERCQGLFSAYS